jgi:Spy/CpxP family protein refolding chaperone
MIKSRSAAIRLLALAFALGGLAGGAATMLADRGNHARPEHGEDGRQGYVSRLNAELDLTADQQDVIGGVLRRHEPVMDSMFRAIRAEHPELDQQRMAVRQEIRAALTPDQVAKYDAMLARRDSAHRAREATNGNK